ncbi:MAG: AEC family transporter [Oscillospiraceae bacterium]|nr:AEC family transporter [Oscillospiraceae bacterium]
MENLLVCVNALLPIFIIIGAGFLSKTAGLIREEDVPRFNAVCYKVFMPVLCFYNLYSSDLSVAVRPGLLIFIIVGILITFALSCLYACRFVSRRDRRGVMIQGLFRSNFVIMGVPIATRLVGVEELSMIAVSTAVVVPFFNGLAVVALQLYAGKKTDFKSLVLGILKNPLILGTAAAFLAILVRLRLPEPVMSALGDMSKASSTVLLFLLGAFFRFNGFEGQGKDLTAACLGRLVIIPGVALTIAWFLGFRGMEFVTLMALFGAPAAVNSFSMTQQIGGDAALAGNIVVLTSLLTSLTLFGWSFLFKVLGAY